MLQSLPETLPLARRTAGGHSKDGHGRKFPKEQLSSSQRTVHEDPPLYSLPTNSPQVLQHKSNPGGESWHECQKDHLDTGDGEKEKVKGTHKRGSH
jgi:hypothetical protein